jgi:histidine ammonia-lyase
VSGAAGAAAPGAVVLDDHLTLADFEAVVRRGARVALTEAARRRIEASRALVERMIGEAGRGDAGRGDAGRGEAAHGTAGGPVYGVNTGFGRFESVRIAPGELRALQRNLVVSHAIGVGEPFPAEVVRGMLLLRAQSLAIGASGVRPVLIERLLDFLNLGVHPAVPSQGSVGASGDLAPLAHMALALIGEGEVEHRGALRPSAGVLSELGLEPLVLEAKEGLALVNGTQAMASLLALVVIDAEVLMRSADVAAAMSVEALKGSHRPFDEAVTLLRPHPGAALVAANMRALLRDSPLNASHADCDKVQDAYSLRAVPQVHGAVRDALAYVRRVLEIEFDSVTDNPLLVVAEERAISAGNFHGEPLALAADHAALALAELANIAERRVEQMLNPALSGLPAFLAADGGLNSGLMISQYTAAALVSENKVLAHPASVDSIPTSANQEDHVSMGTIACRQARMVLENASWVVAIEVMSAAQALDFRAGLRPGIGVHAAHQRVRATLPHLEHDEYLRPGLTKVRELVRSGDLVRSAEAAAGSVR